MDGFNAGIGGGDNSGNGGTIIINGGRITAKGGQYGAGIGGGCYVFIYWNSRCYYGDCGTVTINGGTVTATGGKYASGIGGGYWGSGGNITVNGGTVTAKGGQYASGIGGGYRGAGGTITLGWTKATDSIYASSYGGTVTASKTFLIDGTDTEITGSVSNLSVINGKTLVPKGQAYVITVSGGNVTAPSTAKAGDTVTLTYTGEIPAGYKVVFLVNGEAISGDTFTMPEGTVEVSVTLEKVGFAPQDPDTPEFARHSLILSGQIGVIFYVYAPEGSSSADYCIYFDVSGDKSQNTQPTYPFETYTEYGNTFFGFRCYINSIQMADKIHAVLDYGGSETISHDYTAKEYLDVVVGNETLSDDLRELARRIKDYGCYVQPVLADYNGWEIGKKHASMDCEYAYDESEFADVQEATKDYAISRDELPSGIESLSYALILDSETALEIYLTPGGDYTGSVAAFVDGGAENMAEKKGSEYVVNIGNISAHKLGETHTVRVVTDNGEVSVNISALSYVHGAIQDSDPAMKRTVTSIYYYWDANMTYRKNRPNEYKD